MKYAIIGRGFVAIALACGAFAAGCDSDSRELIDAIIDAHLGQGPSGPPSAPECPDVCEAICAGEPEPELPPGCPIPGCACD
jgi:hypothetical protein